MPSKHPSTPRPDRALILKRLETRGISVRAVAARLEVDRGHLLRVLNGARPGSRALIESAAALSESMPPDDERKQKDDIGRQFDICRLISAAAHVFFLKRGDFENEMCNGAARRKKTEDLNNH